MSELNASNLRKEHGNEGPDLVGVTELTSPYFMVPPSGTTAERPQNPQKGTLRFNTDIGSLEYFKGNTIGWEQIERKPSPPLGTRGIAAAGDSNINTIDYITVSTTGNSTDFGDLTEEKQYPGGCASETRGLFGGGGTPTIINTIDYITIAVLGNAINFGDLAVVKSQVGSTSSSTRGFWWDGAPSHQNSINYVTHASLGDATDFGDDTVSRDALFGGIQSSTRGVMSGGNNSGTRQDVQSYITMASTGNAVDFGNLTESRNTTACSSPTRGVCQGGDPNSSAGTNIVDYIEISSTGNATDFGDLSQARRNLCSVSSPLRAVCIGGKVGSTEQSTMDYGTIATLGNYVDFGDVATTAVGRAALSNGHGGL